MAKTLTVLNEEIRVTDDNYLSLTDMLRSKDGDFFITDWLRNRNTIEYLGIWERVHNPNFNYGEFAIINPCECLRFVCYYRTVPMALVIKNQVEPTNTGGNVCVGLRQKSYFVAARKFQMKVNVISTTGSIAEMLKTLL